MSLQSKSPVQTHAPSYNPDGQAVTIFDAAFAPTSLPMVAHYVWINEETTPASFEHQTMPVLGVLTRHYVDRDGLITDVENVFAVQYEAGCESVVSVRGYADGTNMGFVGVYSPDFPPAADEIARVATFTWQTMQRLRAPKPGAAA